MGLVGIVTKYFSGQRSFVAGLSQYLRTNAIPRFLLWAEGRDWDLSFGPVDGEKGTITTICVVPQAVFQGEKLMANDSLGGTGTRITQILVGNRMQRPCTGGGSLTLFYSHGALGNGLKWDIGASGHHIELTVSFIEKCQFDAVVFGRAVV